MLRKKNSSPGGIQGYRPQGGYAWYALPQKAYVVRLVLIGYRLWLCRICRVGVIGYDGPNVETNWMAIKAGDPDSRPRRLQVAPRPRFFGIVTVPLPVQLPVELPPA